MLEVLRQIDYSPFLLSFKLAVITTILLFLIGLPILGMYWWVYSIPEATRSNFLGGNVILSSFFKNSIYLTVLLVVLSIITMMPIPKYMNIILYRPCMKISSILHLFFFRGNGFLFLFLSF
ncbi:MAG: hypothetical protein ACP5LO_09475 [Calditerrivibrio sp.]|uniref:hypothetical protein n=1 Tax=Calditerrivibrio sp. TaxID=2792612 RepID=UPI003D0B0ADF